MFKEFQFPVFINEALLKLQFQKPTSIQERVIPLVLQGKNVIGKSETGTGKTHAFLLPLLSKVQSQKKVQICIVVPTRELAMQIYEETLKITGCANDFIDVRVYVGGTDRDNEIERLNKSQPDVVIGTIGKIKDLAIQQNALQIHTAEAIVIDEADMVFANSEMEDMDNVFAKFSPQVQILAFSATFSEPILQFLHKYFGKLEVIDLSKKNISKANIVHYFIPTKNKNKDELLKDLLTNMQPYLALIFANTKVKVDEIANYLADNNYRVGKLTGDLEARTRKQMLRRIKEGEFQFVVATDIAARGIDIAGVSHVINYELPNDLEYYVHRTGRTARADFSGFAISFYDFDDDRYLDLLEQKGLKCRYRSLKNGELLPTKERNARSKRVIREAIYEQKAHASTPLPKKIKPAYRKKRNEIIQKKIRKAKREFVSEIYRKRSQKQSE
ncbi:MAG TPA: DEAD/DEAH box helicase [Bacilli bacterium]|nr:DEAD/DEAH box helicase [Bacilli bacterium]